MPKLADGRQMRQRTPGLSGPNSLVRRHHGSRFRFHTTAQIHAPVSYAPFWIRRKIMTIHRIPLLKLLMGIAFAILCSPLFLNARRLHRQTKREQDA